MRYNAAAAQFYKKLIAKAKDREKLDKSSLQDTDLNSLHKQFAHVCFLANRETPVACHIPAEAFEYARLLLKQGKWFDFEPPVQKKKNEKTTNIEEVYKG